MKHYKFQFSPWGAVLFLVILLPTLLWAVYPAPNDILRADSRTGIVDMAASVCQVLFVAALCLLKNQNSRPLRPTALTAGAVICTALYYAGWVLYYQSLTGPAVILLLTVPPCAAFLLFAYDRKNGPALIFAAIFTLCHLYYGVVNFILP